MARSAMRPKPTSDPIPDGLREALFARDGQRCRRCRKGRGEVTLTASHRLPAGKGGPWMLANLDTLCQGCHMHIEEHPTEAEEEGWRIAGSAYVKSGTLVLHGVDEMRHADWCAAFRQYALGQDA